MSRSRAFKDVALVAWHIETPFKAGNPPLESAEYLEQLIEATAQGVVLTVVFNLCSVKTSLAFRLLRVEAGMGQGMAWSLH